MQIEIRALFPAYFDGRFSVCMMKRARAQGLISIQLIDIRDLAEGKHRKVDDRPYGGGPGMLLMPGPVTRAIRSRRREGSHAIYLSPQGKKLTSPLSEQLAREAHLILV